MSDRLYVAILGKEEMPLSVKEAHRLKSFLDDLSEETEGLSRLRKAMRDEKEDHPSRPTPPSRKSIKRISTQYTIEDIANGRAPTAILIYRFLERTKWRLYGSPVTLTEQAAEFLRTDDMSYSDDDIRRLEGDYFMYRRYWLDPGQDLFMRSFLRIKKFHEGDVFLIREFQNWPEIDFQETAQGYLFRSGKAILALMKSVQRTTVKFYSITNLSPNHKSSRAVFSSFSGNGIAASDVPPHTGYGFHCKRIEKDRVPMSERVKSKRYTFDEMQNEHRPIFKEIIRYENFRGIDFGPEPR